MSQVHWTIFVFVCSFQLLFAFTTFKYKLPPLFLKPLKSTGNIRYSHFVVSPGGLSFRFSTYLNFLSDCKPANLTFFLRPHSLPLVAPDPVAPPGVLLLPDVYNLNLEIVDDRPIVSNFHSDTESLYDFTYSRKGLGVSVDIKRYCPEAGTWFVGVFVLDHANDPRCSSWMFSEVSTDVVTNMHTIILSSPTLPDATKHDENNRRPSDIQKHPSTTGSFPGSVSPQSSVTSNSPHFRGKRFFHTSRDADDQKSIFNMDSSEDSFSSVNDMLSANSHNYSWLSALLKPSEGRLFRLVVLPDMTSMDFAIVMCILSPSSTRPSKNIHPTQSDTTAEQAESTTPLCPILVDAGRGVLPTALINDIRVSASTVDTSKKFVPLNRSSVTLRTQKIYRFDGLHDSSTVHYFYLRNLDPDRTMRLQLAFTPIFGCPFTNPPEDTSSYEYRPQHNSKQFSHLSGGDQPLHVPGAPVKDNTSSDPLISPTSLLPWLNQAWPNLTPLKAGSSAINNSLPDVFVDPSEPFSRALDRCFTLSSPSRVSRTQAFTYHFTYQPEMNQYSSALRISPWNVMVIPIHLDSKLDTGGSLEISLQLNAFDLTLWVNETHSKPLPRQVILHACFARHQSISPRDFIHPKRCPAWLRLATDHGVYVSVAQAVLTAVSEELLRSQPPHRSERPPTFDHSFKETMDRSFFYLPYPPPGQWYLSLYAECYSNLKVLCSQHPASTVDVAFVIRSTPCLHHRCRSFGEGASLPPSRVLDSSLAQLRPLNQTSSANFPNKRWRPFWWNVSRNDGTLDNSLGSGMYADVDDDTVQPYEGLCVELMAESLYTSTCACPPGRFGMGCMYPNEPVATKYFKRISSDPSEVQFAWHGYSKAALFLSLSNLAFLPSIIFALVRCLWIPAVAYTYTLVFSSLYHLCDTDVMNIPVRIGAQAIGGDAMSFGGYALSKHRGYHIVGMEQVAYHSAPRGFRFTSPACPLPLDVLSFCDFFGGFFSLWATFVAACALPVHYAQLLYVLFVLVLTITVQIARYSAINFAIPCAFGFVMLIFSWIVRSRQTGRLFPPVQWWILSFIPGLICALSGVILFVSPLMKRDYTLLHSLWHILLGLSLICMLPWPDRWRIALSPAIPLHVPLSCGGTVKQRSNRKASAHVFSSESGSVDNFDSCFGVFGDESTLPPTHSNSRPSHSRFAGSFPIFKKVYNGFEPAIIRLRRAFLCCWWNYKILCFKWGQILELKWLLDPLVRRWPKLQWLLPHGYVKEHTRHETNYAVPDASNVIGGQEELHGNQRREVLHSIACQTCGP